MAKTKRAKELADEILRPLGLRHSDLEDDSNRALVKQMESVIERGKENELYDRQSGWQKGER